jgi:hypothetical protein
MSLSDLSADDGAVQRTLGGAGETGHPCLDAAREARRRSAEQLRAAQKAAQVARLARQKAEAMDERVTLLEAQFLARWQRRHGPPSTDTAPTTHS